MGVNGVISSQWASLYGAYQKNADLKKEAEPKEDTAAVQKNSKVDQTEKTDSNTKTNSKSIEELYTKGRTVGKPTLSKAASEVYERLQQKYGNMSFVLVSEDQKQFAQQNAGSFGNSSSTVVLINEDKLEQMANDEAYAAQIEAQIEAAQSQLPSLQQALASSGSGVTNYGIQVNDDGTTSFFAVMEKSMEEQRERIAENREEKKAEAKAEAKKAEKAEFQERIDARRESGEIKKPDSSERDTITFKANSVEELITMVNDYQFNFLSNNVKTESELALGQSIDFKG